MLLKELEEDPSRSHWGTHEGVDSLLGLHTQVLSRLVPMTGSNDAIYWCVVISSFSYFERIRTLLCEFLLHFIVNFDPKKRVAQDKPSSDIICVDILFVMDL